MSAYAQNFFSRMVDAIADAVYVKDAQHKWLYLNKPAYKLLQVSENDIKEKNEFDFFKRKTAWAIYENDRKVFEKEEPAFIELPIELNGRTCYMAFHSSLFTVAKEKYVVCTVRDVTKRRMAENRLREAQKRFALLADYVDVGVITCNVAGEIGYANQRALDYIGLSQEQLRQSLVTDILKSPERLQILLDNQKQKPQSKIVESFDDFVKHASGIVIPIHVRITPVFQNGKFMEILLILKDAPNDR